MKRTFDILLAILILTLASPILVIISSLIFYKLGRPIIFAQERPGKLGKPFKIFKFRTMSESFDDAGNELPDEQRLTDFGVFLRRYSLDEPPSLINVIKGDMSFVGPRPLLMEYLPLYNEEQSQRHNVLPGITGWAQVNGRNAISWDEKFELDLWYVYNQSFTLDLKIICQTVGVAIKGKGVDDKNGVGQRKFTGSKKQASQKTRIDKNLK